MCYGIIRGFCFLILLLNSLPGCEKDRQLQRVQFNGNAQGTTYQVIYLSEEGASFQQEMEEALAAIDRSLSLYLPGSLINQFNGSDRGIKMDRYFREVVRKGQEVSELSDGAFDLTVKPLVDAWGFGEKRHTQVPDSSYVEELLQAVDYRLIGIKGDSLVKKHPGVRIDANGIAQGYTLDVLAGLLEEKNITDYLIELGGEIRVKGRNEAGRAWRIGIEAPPQAKDESDGENAPALLSRLISVSGKGLSTSGNYRKFFESGGKHYAHTIDPRTGYPVQNQLISVTVVAPDCITADAWDNAFMVLGIPASFEKLKELPGVEAFFIYYDAQGRVRDTSTAGFQDFYLN